MPILIALCASLYTDSKLLFHIIYWVQCFTKSQSFPRSPYHMLFSRFTNIKRASKLLSLLCPIFCCNTNILSAQDLPTRKPLCSFFSYTPSSVLIFNIWPYNLPVTSFIAFFMYWADIGDFIVFGNLVSLIAFVEIVLLQFQLVFLIHQYNLVLIIRIIVSNWSTVRLLNA